MSRRLRVLLAEDQYLVREGTKRLLVGSQWFRAARQVDHVHDATPESNWPYEHTLKLADVAPKNAAL